VRYPEPLALRGPSIGAYRVAPGQGSGERVNQPVLTAIKAYLDPRRKNWDS